MSTGHRARIGGGAILALSLTALTVGADEPPATPSSRPANVVLILADDLGYGDVGFNGRTEWATPNLDRLAARGTLFRRFYTAAVVCAPSRAALMTGKSTIHNRVSRNNDDLPSEEVTIAEALKVRGYATALFGKWHHGRPRTENGEYVHPMDQGFDEFFGFTDATHAWEQFPKQLWDGRKLVPVDGYANEMFTDRAVAFLERQAKSKTPFFLYLPYIATHFHIEAPEDEVALHRGKFPEVDPTKPVRATYAAMVTRLDKLVGQVTETLEKQGLTRDTLIIFTSDHGATFEAGNRGTSNFHDSNRPFRGQKRTLWEGGIRVPALACWPGRIPAGRVSEDVTHMTDLFPTFLAAAGAPADVAAGVDGRDRLARWTASDPKPEPPRTLFWEWRNEGSHQLAAMRGPFKLVVTQNGRPELFDVITDPAERRNCAAEHPALVRELQQALGDWLKTEIEPSLSGRGSSSVSP